MAYDRSYHAKHLQTVYAISWDPSAGSASVESALSDFELAIADIQNLRSARDASFYYTFNFRSFGAEYDGEYEFDPVSEDNISFFSTILMHTEFHEKVDRCMGHSIDLLGSNSLFECQGCQLAEPMVSFLAMGNKRFTAAYVRFLDVWDWDHGSLHLDVIPEILRLHGECAETEQILEINANLHREPNFGVPSADDEMRMNMLKNGIALLR